MPSKPIDRLLFAQGGQCFFCHHELSPPEASVEHLVATSNGGSNDPDNCVACCKALNVLLGHMSLKEKLRVVLNQKGEFKCPNGESSFPKPPTADTTKKKPPELSPNGEPSSPKPPAVDTTKKKPSEPSPNGASSPPKLPTHQVAAQRLALVVADLRKRGASRPSTVKTLSSTIGALFQKKLTNQEVASLLGKLQSQGIIKVSGTKVAYKLPPSVA
ncbi:MAG: HNH endonuclease [Planctomycetota bacterium]